MERYTFVDKDGYCIDGTNGKVWSNIRGRFYGKAIDRLAAYEDTGLTPEEVAKCGDYREYVRRRFPNLQHIDVLSKADADGRLVVLPCKVGDTVYQRDYYGNLYEATVQSIVIDNRRMIFITSGIGFDCDAIGKSVFFTCEEAEAALKQEAESNG